MIDIDWAMLAAAGLGGALAAGLFLGGLALGVRLALGFRWPVAALLVSAALRIGALLWVGWLVAAQGAWDVWSADRARLTAWYGRLRLRTAPIAVLILAVAVVLLAPSA